MAGCNCACSIFEDSKIYDFVLLYYMGLIPCIVLVFSIPCVLMSPNTMLKKHITDVPLDTSQT